MVRAEWMPWMRDGGLGAVEAVEGAGPESAAGLEAEGGGGVFCVSAVAAVSFDTDSVRAFACGAELCD